MRIKVLGTGDEIPDADRDMLILRKTDWNDWWKWATQFHLSYIDERGVYIPIGRVKIGQEGMAEGSPGALSSPELAAEMDDVPADVFSLGQDSDYYESMKALGSRRTNALGKLGDIAYDDARRDRVREEYVLRDSLLREISMYVVEGQLARLAHGGARLTQFDFRYVSPAWMSLDALTLDFAVRPESHPPTNIHVLIGRNGVGKSTLLNHMARSLVSPQSGEDDGRFTTLDGQPYPGFGHLVSVAFSIFDNFPPIESSRDPLKFGFSYIGDQSSHTEDGSATVNQRDLLAEAFGRCLAGARKRRLRAALLVLENDPMFAEFGLSQKVNDLSADAVIAEFPGLYGSLSSGHAIVLQSIVRLVDAVEEKTLVLIDEPEGHLHPPLLSAYVRALSDLLIDQNGVAIVATHSPVVLQEVPASCVYRLSRAGNQAAAARLDLETFGENVGTLTNEVFGLEVTATGFHRMLTEVAVRSFDYADALGEFEGQLGAEARAILRARLREQTSGSA